MCILPDPDFTEEVRLMTVYEVLMVVISVIKLIIDIIALCFRHKKSRPEPRE